MIKCWLVVLAAGIFSPALTAEQVPVSDPGEAAVAEQPADAGFPSPVPDSRDAGIEFSDVWVRAIPPFQPNSAAYLTLTNHRETAIAITSARSSAAQKTELHTTRMVDGLMRMEKLDGLAVAPGERVELVPGGKHLMLIGLAFRPVPGDEITLCFHLASAEEICTLAEVRRSDRSETHDHQH